MEAWLKMNTLNSNYFGKVINSPILTYSTAAAICLRKTKSKQ